jgi:hypothetical protein
MVIYQYNGVLTAFAFCVSAAFGALTLGFLFYFLGAGDLGGISLAVLFGVLAALLFRGLLSRATIVIDDQQITARNSD